MTEEFKYDSALESAMDVLTFVANTKSITRDIVPDDWNPLSEIARHVPDLQRRRRIKWETHVDNKLAELDRLGKAVLREMEQAVYFRIRLGEVLEPFQYCGRETNSCMAFIHYVAIIHSIQLSGPSYQSIQQKKLLEQLDTEDLAVRVAMELRELEYQNTFNKERGET